MRQGVEIMYAFPRYKHYVEEDIARNASPWLKNRTKGIGCGMNRLFFAILGNGVCLCMHIINGPSRRCLACRGGCGARVGVYLSVVSLGLRFDNQFGDGFT